LYFRVFEGPEVIPPPPVDTGHHTSDPHAHHADFDAHLKSHAHQDAHGGGHGDAHGHNHEPAVMMWPLYLLAIGAVISGVVLYQGHRLGHFLSLSPSMAHAFTKANGVYDAANVTRAAFGFIEEDTEVASRQKRFHLMMMIVSGAISLAGIGVAYLLHLKDRRKADEIAAGVPGFVNALDHKYWVDEIYQATIVEPLRAVGRVLAFIDRFFVDGLVNAVGIGAQALGVILRLFTQRGYLQGYALTMLLGIAIILILVFM
jgi:NADH:ubiquinone oxidoreductase subunit 5 (subunit L)/multisubunit Na+/H+ antiporter MnhA subunit